MAESQGQREFRYCQDFQLLGRESYFKIFQIYSFLLVTLKKILKILTSTENYNFVNEIKKIDLHILTYELKKKKNTFEWKPKQIHRLQDYRMLHTW